MGVRFWNAFVKVTGWPVQFFSFRTKVYYENRAVQNRRIHGPAILVSNHTSVLDYAVWLFVFFSRTLRFQMAEVLFHKKALGRLLRHLGGIFVDRGTKDFSFLARSEEILRRGGVVGVFPEGRLRRPGENEMLPFAPSTAYLALAANVPVIPVYTDGSYFRKKRARVMIGTPVLLSEWIQPGCSEKENLAQLSAKLRERILELEGRLHEAETK